MKKITISLIAFATISTAAFAANDASNGFSSRNIADSITFSAPASDFVNNAGVVTDSVGSINGAFQTQIGDREAGASSH